MQYAILKNKKVIIVPFEEWLAWFKDTIVNSHDRNKERTVKRTFLDNNKIEISTVFLAINHRMLGDKDLWFETMIFGGKHNLYQNRYETWEEAKEGHEKAVELVMETK